MAMFLKSRADKPAFCYPEYFKGSTPPGFQLALWISIGKDLCLILIMYLKKKKKAEVVI